VFIDNSTGGKATGRNHKEARKMDQSRNKDHLQAATLFFYKRFGENEFNIRDIARLSRENFECLGYTLGSLKVTVLRSLVANHFLSDRYNPRAWHSKLYRVNVDMVEKLQAKLAPIERPAVEKPAAEKPGQKIPQATINFAETLYSHFGQKESFSATDIAELGASKKVFGLAPATLSQYIGKATICRLLERTIDGRSGLTPTFSWTELAHKLFQTEATSATPTNRRNLTRVQPPINGKLPLTPAEKTAFEALAHIEVSVCRDYRVSADRILLVNADEREQFIAKMLQHGIFIDLDRTGKFGAIYRLDRDNYFRWISRGLSCIREEEITGAEAAAQRADCLERRKTINETLAALGAELQGKAREAEAALEATRKIEAELASAREELLVKRRKLQEASNLIERERTALRNQLYGINETLARLSEDEAASNQPLVEQSKLTQQQSA
jgi:hypothetical protein